jgi:chromosome segregation ATPase
MDTTDITLEVLRGIQSTLGGVRQDLGRIEREAHTTNERLERLERHASSTNERLLALEQHAIATRESIDRYSTSIFSASRLLPK